MYNFVSKLGKVKICDQIFPQACYRKQNIYFVWPRHKVQFVVNCHILLKEREPTDLISTDFNHLLIRK